MSTIWLLLQLFEVMFAIRLINRPKYIALCLLVALAVLGCLIYLHESGSEPRIPSQPAVLPVQPLKHVTDPMPAFSAPARPIAAAEDRQAEGKAIIAFADTVRLSPPSRRNQLFNGSWEHFISTPRVETPSDKRLLQQFRQIQQSVHLLPCSAEVEQRLNEPMLSKDDSKWCKWALTTGKAPCCNGVLWCGTCGSMGKALYPWDQRWSLLTPGVLPSPLS